MKKKNIGSPGGKAWAKKLKKMSKKARSEWMRNVRLGIKKAS